MVLWMAYVAGFGTLWVVAATLLERTVHARRRLLWAGTLGAAVAAPLLLPALRRLSWAPAGVLIDIGDALPVGGAGLGGGPAATGAWSPDLVVAWLWAATSLALAGALLGGVVHIRRARRSWRPTRVDGMDVVVSRATGPAVVGVWRPEIVLPPWVLDLPPAERRLILAHEDEHRRRGDPALLAAGLALPVLMPWNPALWWGFARLREAIETDCDGRVVTRVGGPVIGYARLLVDVGARTVGRVPLAAGFGERRSSLERRVRNMLGRTKGEGIGWKGLALRLVIAAVLVGAACTIEVNINTQDEDEPAISVTAEERVGEVLGAVEQAIHGEDTDAEPGAGTDADERGAEADFEATERVTERTPVGDDTGREEMGAEADDPRRRLVRIPPPGAPGFGEAGESETQPPVEEAELAAGPTFTPFTVAPSILNRSEVIRAMEQEYPPLLRDAGIGGTVKVYFFIDAEGEVQDVRLDTSSGHAALDAAAMAVAGVYRFSPALNRDRRVPVWVSFPITFQVR